MRGTFDCERCWQQGAMVFLLGIFLGAAASFAQVPTATILGTVQDASGAVVPQATLTARNVETGARRTTVSAADGSYRFAALPVGSYEVTVEQAGFQSSVRSGLQMSVGREAVVNFSLQVGAVEQRVEVTAEAPLVNTTTGTLGGLVDSQEISELPLNGRNYADLALLQPGVQRSRIFAQGSDRRMTAYSSSGAPLTSNQTTMDGARVTGFRAESTATSVSGGTMGVDGIQEFRVVTNALSAEYGMSMGSQMVLVSKSGTNTFHGSLFEYHRNENLDARNFFDYSDDLNPQRLPPFVRNQFGGSIGGPILRDKTFFHVNFEGLRERLAESRVADVLPPECRVDGGCVETINPVTRNLIDIWPLPNLPNNQYFDSPASPIDQNYGQARIDHTFTEAASMFGRYTVDDSKSQQARDLPGIFSGSTSRVQFLTLSENQVISPTVINQARFSYSRTFFDQTAIYTIEKFGTPGPGVSLVEGKELGVIEVGSLTAFNPPGNNPTGYHQQVISVGDDVFYTAGAHSLKFGGQFNMFHQDLNVINDGRGVIEFDTVESFLLGVSKGFSSAAPGSNFDMAMRFSTIGFYLQDDWRVRPGLTLNLGLRYEFSTQPNETSGGHAGALRNITDPEGTPGIPFQNSSKRNFSPRFGFAWDVTGNSMTSVRGGIGILYDLANMGQAFRQGSIVPPFGSLISLAEEEVPSPLPALPVPIPAGRVGKSLEIVDFHLKQPRLYQWNLTVERQLPFDMAFSAGYVGTRGVRLFQVREGNPRVPEIVNGQRYWPARAPRVSPHWDDIQMITTGAGSWYHGLQSRVSKRLSNGLQLQTSYTFSKVLDDTQGQSAGEQKQIQGDSGADPGNIHYDWGPASFDHTHSLSFNSIYHLPNFASSGGFGKLLNGWWMSNILSLNSGTSFTPSINRQWGRTGIRGTESRIDRPNIKPGRNNDNIVLGGADQYFDPTAYELQPEGFKGNSSRGHLRGPGFATLDFSLVKDTPVGFLGEAGKIVFRAEFFNILNRVNFEPPEFRVFAGRLDDNGNPDQTIFNNAGRITGTIAPSRQIQLALRLEF